MRKIAICLVLVISIVMLNVSNIYATSGNTAQKHTLGEIIKESEDFISAGEKEGEKISQDNLKNLSDTIYNILLVLGIVVAVIVGVILGIKFMTEGVEGQAEIKKALIPYIIGCVIVFGAFTIWKIVVDIMQTM